MGAAGERLIAEHSGAEVVVIDGSHLFLISQSQAVADLILTAVAAVSQGHG